MGCLKVGTRRVLFVCGILYVLGTVHLITHQDITGRLTNFQDENASGSASVTGGHHLHGGQEDAHERYHTKYNYSIDVHHKILQNMDFPPRRFVHLNRITVTQFVFVTAASGGFLGGAFGVVATVQKYYPTRKIIFYYLGRSGRYKHKIQSMCNVEYRKFNFTKYPPHVRSLKLYTWKPLVIYEVLKEYSGVFWLDSSARFLSDHVNITYHKLLETDGILLFNYAGHTTFIATHKATYDYIPTNITEMQSILQYEANIMMIFGTQSVFHDVIKWWVLCALVERCMAPVLAYSCRKTKPDVWAGCHRYDQTVLNILLANKYKFNYTVYAKHYDNFEVIKRGEVNSGELMMCSDVTRADKLVEASHIERDTPKTKINRMMFGN